MFLESCSLELGKGSKDDIDRNQVLIGEPPFFNAYRLIERN
jgi:hypothetical protein